MMKNCFKNIFLVFVMIFSILRIATIDVFADDTAVLKWNTYDDDNAIFQYENMNDWHNGDTRDFLNGGTHVTKDTTKKSSVRFNFLGTEFCLRCQCYKLRNNNINVIIDGKIYNFSAPQYLIDGHTKYYESPVLENKQHTVIIEKAEPYTDGRNVFDQIDIKGELLPYSSTILNVEPERQNIKLNENTISDVTIDNITEIVAEDMIIKYDTEKLKFLGAEAVDGIKVVKDDEIDGQLRVILASQGKKNIANVKKTLLKLNFQGIAVGDALVDITKGKISDGIEMERDLTEDECGQAVITIEDYKDPNKDGEFTLLDLAIDGRYYGENPSDLPEYKTDVVENGAIDDEDLIQIGKYMLENPNYTF